MFVSKTFKNDKQHKMRRVHMRSILFQVKNRHLLDQIEAEMKMSGSIKQRNRKVKPVVKKMSRQIKNTKNESVSESEFSIREQLELSQQADENDKENKQIDGEPIPNKPKRVKKRNSTIQLKLEEIVKYSKMYPSRRTSQMIIDKKIKQLLQEKPLLKKSSKFGSRFHHFRTQKSERQKQKLMMNSSMMLDMIDLNKNNDQSIQKQKERERERDEQEKYEETFVTITQALKKSQQFCNKKKEGSDYYELTNFIEGQLHELKLKKERNAGESLKKSHGPVQSTRFYLGRHTHNDLRKEKVLDLHRFFRGEHLEEEEFSDYVNCKEVEKFKSKFSIYGNMYKKIKDSFVGKKVNLNEVNSATFQNVIYINQSMNQSNPIQKKRQLQQIMKKIHLVN